jgi:hypothetical protein
MSTGTCPAGIMSGDGDGDGDGLAPAVASAEGDDEVLGRCEIGELPHDAMAMATSTDAMVITAGTR